MFRPLARSSSPAARITLALTLGAVACSDSDDALDAEAAATAREMLENRAYVVSERSDELFVMDLRDMSRVGSVSTTVDTGVNANHMAMLSRDGRKTYVMATDKDAIVVVDNVSLEIIGTIAVGAHPTHANHCFDCAPFGRNELWVVNEGGGHHERGDMTASTEAATRRTPLKILAWVWVGVPFAYGLVHSVDPQKDPQSGQALRA